MMNEDRNVVMSFFPKNWRWLAKRHRVLKGLRKDKDPAQFLRALLLHLGSGHSLRETSVRLRQSGIAELSDVALLKRLKKAKITCMLYASHCCPKEASRGKDSKDKSFAFLTRLSSRSKDRPAVIGEFITASDFRPCAAIFSS